MRWEGEQQSDNLEDRRSLGPKKIMVGGGLATLLIVLAGYFLGVDPRLLNQLVDPGQDNGNQPVQQRELTEAEKRSKAFSSTILKFTEVVWTEEFRKVNKVYEPPHMVLFSDRVQTACGNAPSAVGPFYCPGDRTVYLDPTFFDELEQKLGGSKAEFSQAYVIAHEVGHHVQNLLGYHSSKEDNRLSVRLELQADYLAGVWAHYGQRKFHFLEDGDVDTAIKTANAIGDDRLQRRATGFTSPEKYTHGTSQQRVHWFRLGFKTGDMRNLKKIFTMPYEEL